jgi:glycosyltransferase involved in cell wall biosynthesis
VLVMRIRYKGRRDYNLLIAQRLWIVVPAYNESGIISGCLDSIAAQTDTGFTLVVVDNASADDTRDVVECWCRDHADIDGCVITEKRKGTGAAADTGFRFAIDNGADWIARTDADCLVASNWVAAVRRNTARAHMLGGRTRARGDDIRLRVSERLYLPTTVAASRLFGKIRPSNRSTEFLCPYVMCVGNNLAVEARTYEASGGFPRLAIDELPIPNDRALVNRVRRVSPLVRYAPDMVVYNSIRRLRRYGLWRTLRWYASHGLEMDRFEVDVR